MAQLSFKNRIALNYILTTALLVLSVFFVLYNIVKYAAYSQVDSALKYEISNHLGEIKVENGKVKLVDYEEWHEREHNTVEVNPVFVEILNIDKTIIEKSPNLKTKRLVYNPNVELNEFFDTEIFGYSIRQVQVPFYLQQKLCGYIVIAMSLSDTIKVLDKVLLVMSVLFPLILIALFFMARFFAGRSIQPINAIIETASTITNENLESRISLPIKKDELYVLVSTINNLLDRIEATILREKQFTSDASHELRTPLTVLKGTLEVLIRKPRDLKEYNSKVNFCIAEIDRLNRLVDQLLLLARFENHKKAIQLENIDLNSLLSSLNYQFESELKSKNCTLELKLPEDCVVKSDRYLLEIVFINLISNAIKYSNENQKVQVVGTKVDSGLEIAIIDEGIGIGESELNTIFEQFYRTQSALDSKVKGVGLGLSIVHKISLLLNFKIIVESKMGKGSSFKVKF